MSEVVRRPQPGGASRAGSADPVPDADSEGALSRLLDVVLDKGVYLDLELVITVARVPLIAVNLRATIAGVETMLEYGVPGIWDEHRPADAPRLDRTPQRRIAAPPRRESMPTAEFPAALPETRAGGTVWRRGTLSVQGDGMVHWRGTGDRRPSLVLDGHHLDEARITDDPAVVDPVLVLTAGGREERLASPQAAEVLALLPLPGGGRMSGRTLP